jgi:hypothetical protein
MSFLLCLIKSRVFVSSESLTSFYYHFVS